MSSLRTLDFDVPGAWAQAGTGRFVSVAPGVLETEGGPGMLWYTREAFADFRLEVDWRLSSIEDNSGVYVRFPSGELARSDPSWKAGLEVQIDDRGVDVEAGKEGSALHVTGVVYGEAPARLLASRPVGEWNTFVIEARGLRLHVTLNGQEVCAYREASGRPLVGVLGLQNHHEGSRVQFRAPRLQVYVPNG